MKEIVNCAAYSQGTRVAEVPLSEVHKVLKEAGQFVWIGLHEPSEAMLNDVQQEFNLHDLAVEDAHSAHQRSKVELYGDSLFVVIRTAQMSKNKEHHIDFGETHFFVARILLLLYVMVHRFHTPMCVQVAKARPTCSVKDRVLPFMQLWILLSINIIRW